MRHWSSNAWVLAILSVVLMIVTVDYGRQMLKNAKAAAPTGEDAKPNPGNLPDFKVGDVAPDFSLMDAKQKPQTLSKLVKKDTLLCFLCGCTNCRQFQTYVGAMRKELKDKAPTVVSVTTSPPESEAAYKRDVPLEQTILYEKQGGPVMAQYKGHPCPRAYRINPDRTVKWISPSMSVTPLAQEIAYDTAREYQFATAGMKNSSLPQAPNWDLVNSAPKQQPVKQAQAADPKAVKSPTGGSLPPYLAEPTVGK